MITVRRRYGHEELDVREFVRPSTPMVQTLVRSIGRRPARDYWRWVVQHIRYPLGDQANEDTHREQRYIGPNGPLFDQITDDFWSYPSETLRDRVGDCEDRAFLLVSLLRHILPPERVYVAIGLFRGMGHAWVMVNERGIWEVFETTLTADAIPVASQIITEAPDYYAHFWFNDVATHVITGTQVPRDIHEAQRRMQSRIRVLR